MDGYCASHSRYSGSCASTSCARCTACPSATRLAGTKADERQVLLGILGRATCTAGQVLIGDKGYHGSGFEATLTAAIWHNEATGLPVMRSLVAYDH